MLDKERGRTVGEERGQLTQAGKGNNRKQRENRQNGNRKVRIETGRPKN